MLGRPLDYAGDDEEDNSGVISYVSVRNAGVALLGVGRGTTVDHLEAHYGSYLWGLGVIGGTVDIYHVVSTEASVAFFLGWGYQGRGQFWLGSSRRNLLTIKDESRETPDDDTSPNLANLTLMSDGTSFGGTKGLISFEGKGRGSVRNSIVSDNYFHSTISLDSFARDSMYNCFDRYRRGEVKVENNVFSIRKEEDTWEDHVSFDTAAGGWEEDVPDSLVNSIAALNTLSFDTFLVSPVTRFRLALDPTPRQGSSVIDGGIPVQEEGFTAVNHQGAFGFEDDWWSWTHLYQIAGKRNVSGQVFRANADCSLDAAPLPAAGIIVRLETQGIELFATTDANGFYTSNIPEGPTNVSVLPPSDIWLACPGPEPFSLSRSADTTINLALAPVQECAVPTVALGAPFLRRGFDNRYTITYSNTGNITATNTELKLLLDTSFVFIDTDFPLDDITFTDDTIFFQLPDLEPLTEPQSFWIDVNVSIDSELGQEHCTFAEITSDGTCEIQGLRVDADCLGNSVRFRVQNTLSTDLPVPVTYVVIEDEVMLQQGALQLASAATETFTIPATSASTYHFSTISGDVSLRTAATLICNNSPGLPTATFPLADGDPGVAIDCQENIGAYDPNDKSAVPLGIGRDKVIPEHSVIDYRIRFQNTGTDTAFQVIVIDTLPEALDPATVQMGAMSHSGTWTLEGERTLKVIFDNIMLPDSNVNEPASNGFFEFRIAARETAGPGTRIINEADIYFDFNLPIRTNFTYHLIDEFKDAILSTPFQEESRNQFSLYPQPAKDVITLELSDENTIGGSWAAYGIDGRFVTSGKAAHVRQQIKVAAWSRGAYAIVLRDKTHRVIGVKRIMLQ